MSVFCAMHDWNEWMDDNTLDWSWSRMNELVGRIYIWTKKTIEGRFMSETERRKVLERWGKWMNGFLHEWMINKCFDVYMNEWINKQNGWMKNEWLY